MEVSTSRLQTLTDGIFAIAMTLLAFGLPFPESENFALWFHIFWPRFLSFIVSFMMAGVFWVATHIDFQYIRRATHVLVWLNIFFLMFVSLIPFSTGMLGRYPEKEVPVLIYGVNMFACVLLRYSMWRYATKGHRLVDEDLHPSFVHFNTRLAILPLIIYALALLLALIGLWEAIGTWPSLLLYIVTPLPYILGLSYHHLAKKGHNV
jgi:uncharacterized membrane protein